MQTVTGSTPLSFAYDVYGNETSTGRSTYGNYAFDDDSLLQTVSNADGSTVLQYAYDGNRRMTMEQSGSGRPLYRIYAKSGQLLYEDDLAHLSTKEYVYVGSRLVATRTNSNIGAILAPILELLLN